MDETILESGDLNMTLLKDITKTIILLKEIKDKIFDFDTLRKNLCLDFLVTDFIRYADI